MNTQLNLVSIALAVLTIAVASCSSAQAYETVRKRALPGQTIKLDGWSDIPDDCSYSTPSNVRVLSQPHGGAATQRIERVRSRGIGPNGGSIGCRGVIQNSRATYYTARADFSGEDRVALRLYDSGGRTWDYLYIIDVPPGEPQPAVTVSPTRQQNDVNTATSRPTTNPAATNAGDFFAGVEKNATPAGTNKPAPAGTNAGDFFSQVPTQPEQPRSSSTPPASNSSPPQGLGQ